MRIARKAGRGDIAEVIYGINLNTLELEHVMVGRDGTMTKRERDGSTSMHKLGSGKAVEAEVRSFYNLGTLLSLPPGTPETHPEVVRIARKADELRTMKRAETR